MIGHCTCWFVFTQLNTISLPWLSIWSQQKNTSKEKVASFPCRFHPAFRHLQCASKRKAVGPGNEAKNNKCQCGGSSVTLIGRRSIRSLPSLLATNPHIHCGLTYINSDGERLRVSAGLAFFATQTSSHTNQLILSVLRLQQIVLSWLWVFVRYFPKFLKCPFYRACATTVGQICMENRAGRCRCINFSGIPYVLAIDWVPRMCKQFRTSLVTSPSLPGWVERS